MTATVQDILISPSADRKSAEVFFANHSGGWQKQYPLAVVWSRPRFEKAIAREFNAKLPEHIRPADWDAWLNSQLVPPPGGWPGNVVPFRGVQ